MVKLTDSQKETLNKLRAYYCRVLSEDPIDGSNFDCSILDLLKDDVVEQEFNHIHRFVENRVDKTSILAWRPENRTQWVIFGFIKATDG